MQEIQVLTHPHLTHEHGSFEINLLCLVHLSSELSSTKWSGCSGNGDPGHKCLSPVQLWHPAQHVALAGTQMFGDSPSRHLAKES